MFSKLRTVCGCLTSWKFFSKPLVQLRNFKDKGIFSVNISSESLWELRIPIRETEKSPDWLCGALHDGKGCHQLWRGCDHCEQLFIMDRGGVMRPHPFLCSSCLLVVTRWRGILFFSITTTGGRVRNKGFIGKRKVIGGEYNYSISCMCMTLSDYVLGCVLLSW